MSTSAARRIYVARQPILDVRQRVGAYELLYRSSELAERADIRDFRSACLRTLLGVFVDLGTDAIVGGRRAFVNVAPEVLRTDLVEALPKERVALEILETEDADRALRARCRELRKLGFPLALDDYVPGDPRESLLSEVDYVKVDVLRTHPRSLRTLAHTLRRHRVSLIAEKVETAEQFRACQRAGFDLFQGFYFARPATLSGSSIDPARTAILELLAQLCAEADLDRVEETLKHHVTLGLNLLRLVNSVALTRAEKIATVRQAVMLIGERQLRRWLTMLLYAGGDPRGVASPLLELAALRARLMELLATRLASGDAANLAPSDPDRAFLAGMVSLVDALLDTPLEKVLEQIRLEDDIRGAVLEHRGPIGGLLELAERLERGDFAFASAWLSRHDLAPEHLLEAETEAYRWVARVGHDAENTA